MNALQFLSANESALVTFLRASTDYPTITNRTQASGCRQLIASLEDDVVLNIATALGYDPDNADNVTEEVVETIIVPSDVKVITHTNAKGGASKYAQLAFIRMSQSGAFAVCQYGNTEVYARIGTTLVNQYFLSRKLAENPIVAGELINVVMDTNTFKRETEGPMKSLWVSSIHASSMPECQEILVAQEGALTRSDEITIAVANGNTTKQAQIIVAKNRADSADNAIKQARAIMNKGNVLLNLLAGK